RSSILGHGAKNLYQVFVNYKEELLLYGYYCSQVEAATKHLDRLSNTREDIRMKLEECSKRANNGRFSLRDLLMVPMQRVLKYHLLLQELVKHTTDASDKENLRKALDAMKDLAQCVNEVKRDNEIIKQITTFQMSIENLTQSLALYGRPKIDGELKISSSEKKSKQDRCRTFELKEILELNHYQLRDEVSGEKENKKVVLLSPRVCRGNSPNSHRCLCTVGPFLPAAGLLWQMWIRLLLQNEGAEEEMAGAVSDGNVSFQSSTSFT
uniref:DH domain-containing protein n=1 Tax=Oryzias melastigma TaxID=30732 RepID=A0A3B3CL61_ORYME